MDLGSCKVVIDEDSRRKKAKSKELSELEGKRKKGKKKSMQLEYV